MIKAEPFAQLRQFYPLDGFRSENLAMAAEAMRFERHEQGEVLFEAGDPARESYYLLAGSVELLDENGEVQRSIQASGHSARYAVVDTHPRRWTVRVASRSAMLGAISRAYLQRIRIWNEAASALMQEKPELAEGSSRWLARLFASPVLEKVPMMHLRPLLENLELHHCKAGDVIIRQGEQGDRAYIVRRGRCAVKRQLGDTVLAMLGPGDLFGEDALLSASPRNADVLMVSDGELCSIARDQFNALLKQPALTWIEPRQVPLLLRDRAWLLDVRSPEATRMRKIRGAKNLPFERLRETLPKLNRQRRYVVCCEDGHLSAAASFIMKDAGFKVAVMRGGINALLRKRAAATTSG